MSKRHFDTKAGLTQDKGEAKGVTQENNQTRWPGS